MGKLERSRQARVGSWTEKQLHLALSSRGQRSQEELLRLACMGQVRWTRFCPSLKRRSFWALVKRNCLKRRKEASWLQWSKKESFVLPKPGLAPG